MLTATGWEKVRQHHRSHAKSVPNTFAYPKARNDGLQHAAKVVEKVAQSTSESGLLGVSYGVVKRVARVRLSRYKRTLVPDDAACEGVVAP